MKKIALFAFGLLSLGVVSAQQNSVQGPFNTVRGLGAPVGDCRQEYFQGFVDQTTLNTYTCNFSTGAWFQGGSGTSTGTGAAVFATSPTLVTPTLGVATATSIIGLTAASTPNAAGGTTLGSAALPFSAVYIGAAATNNIDLTGTATGARTATFPDASITVSGITLTSCSTSASCASPAVESTVGKIVTGTTAFSSSTTLAITGMPAFTSITSFSCYASDPTHAYTWTAANQSSTAVTFTAGTSNSDSWQWSCIGY